MLKVFLKFLVFMLSSSFLIGCVSYEPRSLVPSISFSAEQVNLDHSQANTSNKSGVDFGLRTSVNESDSLSNIEILPGVRVRGVSINSAASSAGIQSGDIILRIDGMLTNHPDVISQLESQSHEEKTFKFELRRNTVVFEAAVTPRLITAATTPKELYRMDPIASRAGYTTHLLNLTDQSDVAVARVAYIQDDSPLIKAGFSVGDDIIAINGRNVGSAQGLVTQLNRDYKLGETVSISVLSDQEIRQRQLTLWSPGRRISSISLGPILQYRSTLESDSSSLSIGDLWFFSLYNFTRIGEEKRHSLIGIFSMSSDVGELVEDP
ncbi:MAG: hypothetical protein COC19_05355 [SAR86 cluster bacterium]|uniref:PDZ domain-containing protein n=1 Tax=SAR86 cluster bacterium TaxID=2030880 RepID=A0A2A4MMM9_9GAMM|nr:MAG: hypothetical protein COC19_05355 [SAR86 cluster bacterium]